MLNENNDINIYSFILLNKALPRNSNLVSTEQGVNDSEVKITLPSISAQSNGIQTY